MANIRIDVMGLKEDIRALWERLEQGYEYGIEFEDAPQPIDPVVGEYAAGWIEDIPDEEGFDALFEDFPRLCVFISVIDSENWEFAYWNGGTGRCVISETYALDGGDDWDDDFVRSYREDWLFCLWTSDDDEGESIPTLPAEFWDSAERCAAAVRLGHSALEHVPEAHKTAELCLLAVQKGGNALKYVPESLKTAELCLLAVQKSGYALEYVPEELKTAELCLIAVKNCGGALECVPEKLKAQVERALGETSGEDDDDDSDDDDDEYDIDEVAAEITSAVKEQVEQCALEEEAKIKALEAVREDGKALKYGDGALAPAPAPPAAGGTPAPSGKAAKAAPDAKPAAEELLQTARAQLETLLKRAEKFKVTAAPASDAAAWFNQGKIHEKAGEHLQAVKAYSEAIRLNPDYTEAYIERAVSCRYAGKTSEFYDELCIVDLTEALRLSPDNDKIYAERAGKYRMMRNFDNAIADLETALRIKPNDPDHLLRIEKARQESRELQNLPPAQRTAETCLAAVRQNGYQLEYVPEELKTVELCVEAVKQNGRLIRYVPEALKAQVKKAAGKK
jgi:tetratricopeptide (TPR) repeat protein